MINFLKAKHVIPATWEVEIGLRLEASLGKTELGVVAYTYDPCSLGDKVERQQSEACLGGSARYLSGKQISKQMD
jgi:hypothetical protein